MTDIEWLDADGRPLAAAPRESRPAAQVARFDVRSAALWAEGLWVAATALAVVAPFLMLYGVRIAYATNQQVDGWGRFDSALNAAEGSGAHGIRFGIVSCVGAGLVVIALAVRRLWPRRRAAGVVALVACTLAVGLLVATAALVFLDIEALFDSIRSELAGAQVGPIRPSLHVGAGSWTLLAAAVLGLVGLVVDLARRPAPAPVVPVRYAVPWDEPPLGPHDERM